MACLVCEQKFTRVRRKSHACAKCEKRTCMRCIKKAFNLQFSCSCSVCSEHFHPEIYPIPPFAILDKIYAFIKRREILEPPGWLQNFRQTAGDKLPMSRARVKFLKDYLQKFPNDKKMLSNLKTEISLQNVFRAIKTDSELLRCDSCAGGKTTVNGLNLRYLCKVKILSVFEDNTYPYTLPRSITRDLLNTPSRKCLNCNEERGKTLL